MTVTYEEYSREFVEFAKKHNAKAECYAETSPLTDNCYHKEFMWSDGANWFERTELIAETVEVESHGLVFETTVEMWKTEFWSTESCSKYVYSK